jgi:hypothetical protein
MSKKLRKTLLKSKGKQTHPSPLRGEGEGGGERF